MNFPALENLTMRLLPPAPWPSATKISPLGATKTSDGPLKVSRPSPVTPALPSVINNLPSGLNFKTWWPLPSSPRASAIHTLPSLSTLIPCGQTNNPAPKLFSNFPEGSNRRMGGTSSFPTQLFWPHRSATHKLPSLAGYTALVAPQFLPWGSLAQFSTML